MVTAAAGAGVVTVGVRPIWRRAAASMTHDTGDWIGAAGSVPTSPENSDSTSPAAGAAGAGAITGASKLGGTDRTAARAGTVAGGGATAPTRSPIPDAALPVIDAGNSTRSPRFDGAESGGRTPSTVAPKADSATDDPPPRPRDADPASRSTGRSTERPVVGVVRRASRALGPLDSSTVDWARPVRAGVPAGDDAGASTAGAASVSGAESPGDAPATPAPPAATPIPNATAKTPTRPTYADARISTEPPHTE